LNKRQKKKMLSKLDFSKGIIITSGTGVIHNFKKGTMVEPVDPNEVHLILKNDSVTIYCQAVGGSLRQYVERSDVKFGVPIKSL
jgi:hypothetical protein